MKEKADLVIREVNKVIIGKEEIVRRIFMTILSGGHVLLSDVPGVGKTTMALAFSKVLGLSCRRIQFTPDVMPSDVVGFYYYNKEHARFEYRPGAVMTNLVLADEINRTSSRTQSALLEVMEEKQVTVDGVTREVPDPFFVFATQNPIGSAGTQPLPESQIDRFMVMLSMGYPSVEDEVTLLLARGHEEPLEHVREIMNREELLKMQEMVSQTKVSPLIYQYIAMLAQATRNHEMIRLGISPRGSLALCRMAKACAFLSGRDFVIPDDVEDVIYDVYRHRLVLHARAKLVDDSIDQVISDICAGVSVPEKMIEERKMQRKRTAKK